MPVIAKPYHLATVQVYLDKIQTSHPKLYRRISDYFSRYRKTYNVTHLASEISFSNTESKNIPNQRGRNSNSNLLGEASGFIQLSDNWNLSLGATIFDGSSGVIPNNTYLSYFNKYFQLDVGYKEIWLSPLQESSMLLSTHAKPIARAALSSPIPWTKYNLRYDISYGKLEEMDGILFEDESSSGRPGFISTHFSAQPANWWTIGLNRTMVFGGGEREVGPNQVWEAFIDPVNGDNCGGESNLQDCTKETGNQQASVSSKFDINLGTPANLYFELAGEDTKNFKSYSLGNRAYNVGVFLPYLTESSSILFEYQHIENAWYTHHLYQEGYRNDGFSMGHWWGDEKDPGDGIGAKIATLRFNQEFSKRYHWDIKFVTFENQNVGAESPSDESVYQRANEITFGINEIRGNSVRRYEVYFGNNAYGEEFARVSLKHNWY